MTGTVEYLTGFGNEHATEALPGALPVGKNSPQKPPYGLYPELLSGTAFTAPRAANQRTWFYRIRPSVQSFGQPESLTIPSWLTAPGEQTHVPKTQLRWSPPPIPEQLTDFVAGFHTIVLNGDCAAQTGNAAHMYLCNTSMGDRYFSNYDGEMLIVPQQGRLSIRTEAGKLEVAPGEICVIPRGYKFSVDVLDGPSRGYVCENYGAVLALPELGPIGSNALANPRDFQYPVAHYDDSENECELVTKTLGEFFSCRLGHSPLDVVAWHGSYAPYKYDLNRFNTIGSISFDHPDPSIFTVLTSQSDTAGTANLDFVIFPPRWLVAEDTFRPPWFHRNIMSEFMGLIYGVYDAKPDGFVPGGCSLHNSMLPHGPDNNAYEGATHKALEPEKLDHTMAFMFESRYPYRVSDFAMNGGLLQPDYPNCWADLKKNFDPTQP